MTLLAANLAVPSPDGVEVVQTPTAADLAREVLARSDADIVLMAAAVADYRPAEALGAKRPKDGGRVDVTLEPTDDVLAELGRRRRNGQILVGFAADEGEAGLARARKKLANKPGPSSSSTTYHVATSDSTLTKTRLSSSHPKEIERAQRTRRSGRGYPRRVGALLEGVYMEE